ncbi:NAD-dependent epimerase/dehydratase family protein [Saprospira sp. CCB-QB6]|uniref:NAD-dependent epimerase/dehydratase family protein n=1 Tax=Saprospira sp. CCB-QB6 TaxID=3023936 RepID=UPI00234AC3A9|nr:NAD-dependent epimerase/dehydratase family protein [Saprospira sp. CCB-QB6]WCL81218.1 NAD-dependent epimerase/dehydratase family protein [Saprospira sp. CCB-QB6]
MDNKKLLFITGATGFLGAYLVREALKAGYRIRASKRPNSPLDLLGDMAQKIEWREGDLLDLSFVESCLEGVDSLIHAAALVSFQPKEAEKMIRFNADSTNYLVNAALSANISESLFVSSIAALGRDEKKLRIDEQSQWENSKYNSNYAISKFKAECEVWRGIQEGLPACIVNPAVIMGAGYWAKGTAQMFQQVANGLSFYPAGATGFVDVRDVAEFSLALLQNPQAQGQRFILNGTNCSYQTLFTEMATALGKKPPKRKLPAWGVELLWRIEKLRSWIRGLPPLITEEIARNMNSKYEYDNQKVIDFLGKDFRPLSVCMQDSAKLYKLAESGEQAFGLLAP